MGDSKAHAKLSPSSGDRWFFCTAAPTVEEMFPEQGESVFANEGTEAHDLLERSVQARTRPSDLEPEHPAGKDVDQMYDLVSPCLDNPKYVVLSEVPVKLCEDVYGTADLVVLDLENMALGVWDYKHGVGVRVDVPGNVQLRIYAAAALKDLAWMFPAPVKRIVTGIVQPRLQPQHPDGPVRQTEYTPEEIESFGEEVVAAAIEIEVGRTKFCPSEKACKWCRAKGNCAPQADAALEQAQSHFGMVDPKDPESPSKVVYPEKERANRLPVEDMVLIHEAKKFITDFLNAVDQNIEKMLMSGQDVPGLKIVAGRSNRKFGKLDGDGNVVTMTEEEIEDVLIKGCKFKKAEITKTTLLGPAPIEKLIDTKKRNGKKKLETLLSIIVKPEGKPTVVSEDHPGKSIAPHFEDASNDPLA
jgi:hypothetical protein